MNKQRHKFFSVVSLATGMVSIALVALFAGKSDRSNDITVPQLSVSLATLLTDASSSSRKYSREIDSIVARHLSKQGLSRNKPTDDATFLRRAYLNIVGRIPNIEESKSFLNSDASQKRALLIDQLLDSYGHVSHQFNFWADILRIKSRLNNAPGSSYIDFVKDSLEENKPYDRLVRELLSAEGPLLKKGNGAVGYYLRDRNMPEDNMSNTIRVFLGTRLECAQCHDHPFDKWTQRQYFEMVAFTGGLDYSVRDQTKLKRQLREFQQDAQANGMEIDGRVAANVKRFVRAATAGISGKGTGLARLPEGFEGTDGEPNEVITAKTMFDGKPLVDAKIPAERSKKPKQKKKNGKYGRKIRGAREIDSRMAYAEWLTDADNPRFAKVIANRLWKQAFGLGLVEPVDVIEDATVASNPELLNYLTKLMIEIDFDMKEFQRIIYNTRTWQAQATTGDVTDVQNYAFPGPIMQRMSAEQLWDSMVGLSVDSIDVRRETASRVPGFGLVDSYRLYETVTNESIQEIYDRIANADGKNAMMMNSDGSAKQQKKQRNELKRRIDRINKQISKAKRARNQQRVRELLIERAEMVSTARSSRENSQYRRASELPSPAPAKHLLREFGQSDRETIENANREPAVTQVLRLMNGFVDKTLGKDPNSVLTRNVLMARNDREAINAVYLSMLTRLPTKAEMEIWLPDFERDSRSAYTDLVWILINSNEFIFVK